MDIQNPVAGADIDTPPPRSAPPLDTFPVTDRQGPIALPLWTEMSGGPALP